MRLVGGVGALAKVAALLVLAAGCSREDRGVPFDPDREAHRLDLLSLLPQAELRVETRRIDLGVSAARAHLGPGWSQDPRRDDQAVSTTWSRGRDAELRFLVLRPRDLPVTFRAAAFSWPGAPPQTVQVAVDGEPMATLPLSPDLEEHRFTIPASLASHGDHRLGLHYAYAASPHDRIPGSRDRRQLAAVWDFVAFGERSVGEDPSPPRQQEDRLVLPRGTEVRFYLALPGTAHLLIDRVSSQGGRLRVTEEIDGAPAATTDRVFDSGDRSTKMDVSGPRATLARLTLTAEGEAGSTVEVSGLDLRSRKPLPSLPWTQGPSPSEAVTTGGSPRPDVVIFLVDTLRADHLGCYEEQLPLSPAVDGLAGDGVVFEQALAQSSWTRTATASVLTGLLPAEHRVYGRADVLPDGVETLAERLAAAGYATGAFVTNFNVSARFGFAQGFEAFRYFGAHGELPYGPADQAVDAALEWLGSPDTRPFFLYLHLMEPHAPYAPRPATRQRLFPDLREPELSPAEREDLVRFHRSAHFRDRSAEPVLGTLAWLKALRAGALSSRPDILQGMESLYDAEVADADAAFGRLLDALRAQGRYRGALVVFLSDHGEEFLDHGGWGHGSTVYQEQVRVPLIVKPPSGDPARTGKRAEGLALQIDVTPTILDYAGAMTGLRRAGRSLRPEIEETADRIGERSGVTVLRLDHFRSRGAIFGPWKLVCPEMAGCRFYRLDRDPGERHPLPLEEERPVLASYLRHRLTLMTRDHGWDASSVELDPETRRRLEALGYL